MSEKKIFCFDLDNVICTTEGLDYESSKPIKSVIRKINELKEEGNVVKIFTARYMGRNNDDIELAKKQGYDLTEKQIVSWGLKFDELIFGKPVFDVYVDDKNFEFKKNWLVEFSKKY